MFIIHLMGGLGNQMFQWAAGRALSIVRKKHIALHFDDPYIFAKRRFMLDVFELRYRKASWKDLFISMRHKGIFKRIYKIAGKDLNSKFFKEIKDYKFQPQLFTCKDNSYISGFWQSEMYFKDFREIIKKDFQIKTAPNTLNRSMLEKIKISNSISIHIRRGDYITVSHTNSYHGTCPISYYLNAINYIKKTNLDPVFYFFSDDIEWVKKSLIVNDECIYVDINNDENAHEDLRLMQNCKHNIIANSSFSWWAAWLNDNPDKIVIAPKKWLQQPNFNLEDLIPESWILL